MPLALATCSEKAAVQQGDSCMSPEICIACYFVSDFTKKISVENDHTFSQCVQVSKKHVEPMFVDLLRLMRLSA